MIELQTHHYSSADKLLNALRPNVTGTSAIMAGHFMLMYDSRKNQLVPMIQQELNDRMLLQQVRIYAGDFPLRTLRYGIELHKRWLMNSEQDSKLLLLVNDHRFQAFCSDSLRKKLRGDFAGQLRRAYYKQEQIIPECYLAEFESNSVDYRSVVMRNQHVPSNLISNGASVSYVFSEMNLRNRFRRGLQKSVTSFEGFSKRHISTKESPDIFFNNFCLTEDDGECGCSGEMVQLLFDLLREQVSNIILFVPEECTPPVRVGAQAALSLARSHGISSADICVIDGVGGSAEDDDFAVSDIRVDTFSIGLHTPAG